MKQIFNFLGYALTPPALVINIGEWFQQLTINQGFTILISMFVVLFWVFKVRKIFIESQIAKRQLDILEESDNEKV